MKVTMKATISGTRNGKHWPRHGEVVDLPNAEAADLCAAGLAEPVKASEERATAPKPETRKKS